MTRYLRILATSALLTAFAAVPGVAATTGGGSAVQPGVVGSDRFIVSGIGQLVKVGPRYSAVLTVSLYRINPGATRGQLMGTSNIQAVRGQQVTTLITRATCRRVPVARRWFMVALANSRSTRTSPPVRLRAQGPVIRLNCA